MAIDDDELDFSHGNQKDNPYLDDSGNHSKKSEDSGTNGSSTLVRRETAQVRTIRKCTFSLLLLTTAAVGYGIFSIIRQGQIDTFQNDFHDQALKVIDSFHWSLERKLAVLDGLAISVNSEAKTKNLTWPLVSLENFHVRGASTRALAKAVSISLSPLVTSATRAKWERYSAQQQNQRWIQAGFDFEQKKRENGIGENQVVEGVNEDRHGPSDGDSDHRRYLSRKLSLLHETVDTQITHYVEAEHEVIPWPYDKEGPFFPLWQASPVFPELVNMDLLDLPDFHDDIQQMVDTREAVLGKVTDLERDRNDVMDAFESHWSEQGSDYYFGHEPLSKMYFPLFEELGDKDSPLVGMLTAVVFWETYLEVRYELFSSLCLMAMSFCLPYTLSYLKTI